MSIFGNTANYPIITTTTQTQSASPWKEQAPHLTHAFKEARRLYEQKGPQYFPKPSVVPFAPETEKAIELQTKRAQDGSDLRKKSQDYILRLLAGALDEENPVETFLQTIVKDDFLSKNPTNEVLKKTAEGQYLKAPEALDAACQQAIKKLTQHFKDVIEPGIDAKATALGRYGSGHHKQLKEKAYKMLAEQIAELTQKFYAKHHEQERQHQLNSVAQLGQNYELARRGQFAAAAQLLQNYGFERTQKFDAAQMGPTSANTDYDDINRLAEIGGLREALAQTQLNDEVNRWNFTNNAVSYKLAQYLALVSGGYGAENLSTSTQPLYRNQVYSSPNSGQQSLFSLLGALGKGGDRRKNLLFQLGSALLQGLGK